MSELINIQKTFYKIADFISWKKKASLNLSPHFQRRAVWKKGAKSYLVDTIYKGLPVPIIFLRDMGIDKTTYEPIREVIDGQQRLRTIISYIAPELLDDFNPQHDEFLVKKAHNMELAGKAFHELDEDVAVRHARDLVGLDAEHGGDESESLARLLFLFLPVLLHLLVVVGGDVVVEAPPVLV